MIGYIYLTTNLINNKKYIGQHRCTKFDKSYIGSGLALSRAIKVYGKKNFKCEVLKWCETDEELNNSEVDYIKSYDAVNNKEFYNICSGGLGHTCDPWNKGKHGVQVVTQAQLDILEKGRHLPSSEKQKETLRNIRHNFVPSQETSKKLSVAGAKANKGKKMMHKDGVRKYVSTCEIDLYKEQGWKLGKQ